MSVIVAVKDPDGSFHMAADSGHTTDGFTVERGEPKVRDITKALIGCSGSGGLVSAAWRVMEEYGPHFAPDLAYHMREGMSAVEHREGLPFSALWAEAGGDLYVIDGTFGCSRVTEDYTAIGAGRDFALGALSVLMRRRCSSSDPPYPGEYKDRAELAALAACSYSSTCRLPITVHSITSEGKVTEDA